jgi:N-acetylglucosaminyl-diphospho-decaprenol L-rhamnosyltransferase
MSAEFPVEDVGRSDPTSVISTEVTSSAGHFPILIVIVNYKTAGLTIRCLETLEPEIKTIPGGRVTVVENASGEGEILARSIAEKGYGEWARLEIVEHNGGYSFGNNRGIRPAIESADSPRYVLLLNADTEVRPGAIRALMDFMDEHPKVGIAGSSFENLDGSIWPFAFRFFSPWGELEGTLKLKYLSNRLGRFGVNQVMQQDRPQPIDWVAGACMIIRREVFDSVGLLDEGYFLYYEEVDFCLQARRSGWPCWYVPESRIMHIGGQSTGLTERARRPDRTPSYWFASRRRYFRKNFGLRGAIIADLAYGLGFAAWRLRRRLFRKPDYDPPHHLVDFWKNSIFFKWSSPT